MTDESTRPNESTTPDESESGLGQIEYDPITDAYYANYATDDAPPSTVIPRATEAITGRGVGELRPLQEVVDPDALDDIFDDERTADRSGEVEISFVYAGHEVTVRSSGVITFEAVEDEE